MSIFSTLLCNVAQPVILQFLIRKAPTHTSIPLCLNLHVGERFYDFFCGCSLFREGWFARSVCISDNQFHLQLVSIYDLLSHLLQSLDIPSGTYIPSEQSVVHDI